MGLVALPPRALKMQNCWLRLKPYHCSHYVRELRLPAQFLDTQRVLKELGNYRPASLTLVSEKITESVEQQMDKQSLVKGNRTPGNSKSFLTDLLEL